jgi:dynactin complex subunit
MSEPSESGLFSIGDRVHVDKRNASVRYVGSIDGQDGTWVGLEWDDESRGKHDGSHSGRT